MLCLFFIYVISVKEQKKKKRELTLLLWIHYFFSKYFICWKYKITPQMKILIRYEWVVYNTSFFWGRRRGALNDHFIFTSISIVCKMFLFY